MPILPHPGVQVKLQAYLGKGELAPFGIVVEVSAKLLSIGKGAKSACLPTSIYTGFGSQHCQLLGPLAAIAS